MSLSKSINFVAFLFIIFSACNKTYFNKTTMNMVKNHHIIAVVPPIVSMCPRNTVFDTVALSEMFQNQLVRNVTKEINKSKNHTVILNLDSTYARLARIDFFENNIPSIKKLCQQLEVDAIIMSNYDLHEPIKCTSGNYPNKVMMELDLYDKSSNSSIFHFRESRNGKKQKSNMILAEKLTKLASKKLPY